MWPRWIRASRGQAGRRSSAPARRRRRSGTGAVIRETKDAEARPRRGVEIDGAPAAAIGRGNGQGARQAPVHDIPGAETRVGSVSSRPSMRGLPRRRRGRSLFARARLEIAVHDSLVVSDCPRGIFLRHRRGRGNPPRRFFGRSLPGAGGAPGSQRDFASRHPNQRDCRASLLRIAMRPVPRSGSP